VEEKTALPERVVVVVEDWVRAMGGADQVLVVAVMMAQEVWVVEKGWMRVVGTGLPAEVVPAEVGVVATTGGLPDDPGTGGYRWLFEQCSGSEGRHSSGWRVVRPPSGWRRWRLQCSSPRRSLRTR
jgi:hypothetical protein